jgi:hypothetical protein
MVVFGIGGPQLQNRKPETCHGFPNKTVGLLTSLPLLSADLRMRSFAAGFMQAKLMRGKFSTLF